MNKHKNKNNANTYKKKIKNKQQHKIFTRKNYNSEEGFLTTTWGPAIWHFIHTISFNYPIQPTNKQKKT